MLADLHERFIPEHGLAMTGKHHEIYLSDPRRTAPKKLQAILRGSSGDSPHVNTGRYQSASK